MFYDFSALPLPESAAQNLARQAQSGRLSHAVMFTGGAEKGRRAAALALCQALFCKNEKKRPCGKCAVCRQIKAGSYPDVRVITRDDKKKEAVYNVDVLRDELVAKSDRKPVFEDYQIFLLYEMSGIGELQQDTLLKVLENPTGVTRMIMTAVSPMDFRETIRSRITVFSLGAGEDPKNSDRSAGKYDEAACKILTAAASGNEYKLMLALADVGDRRNNAGILERMKELVRDAIAVQNGSAASYAIKGGRSEQVVNGLARTMDGADLFNICSVISEGLAYTDASVNQNLFLCLMNIKLGKH